MPGNSARTPAGMIMTGIMQQRQFFDVSNQQGEYYAASGFLYDVYCLLPFEAKEKLKIPPPPRAKTSNAITPDIQLKCRQWIEENREKIFLAIPEYVYNFFLKGRQLKAGY